VTPTRTSRTRITTALIYTRVSTEEQAREGVSLDVQLSECRRYAAQQDGWVIGKEYKDVLSGKRDDRMEYQALLTEARRLCTGGQRVAVVVMRLDRFGRRVLERVRCRDELKGLGVPTHSVREGGEVPDLLANMLASFAEEEVRVLGERVSAARRHVAALGWFPVGEAPWGYRWRDARGEERAAGAPKRVLEPDPDAAPFVREAFERVAGGASMRSVSRWVATLPSPARSNKPMGFHGVVSALHSPVYIARHPHRDGRDPVSEPIGRWPMLVDEQTWCEARRRVSGHAAMPRQASGRYLLTGLVRCPGCGARMDVAVQRMRTPRYRCSDHVKNCRTQVVAAPVDGFVVDQVCGALEAFASPDPVLREALERAWQHLQEPVATETASRRDALERARARARNRIARATEMLVDGELDRASYDELCDRARADIQATDEELAVLGDQPTVPQLPALAMVLREAGAWKDILLTTEAVARRDVLGHLVERVVPRRTGIRGQYSTEIAWTVLGDALRSVARTLTSPVAA
jgi:DNA invertase Pin-like site-specific DNA recombinase